MTIIALKAWHLEQYEPIKEVIKRPYDLRLSRSSLLKSALRADFLDDRESVEKSEWFENYLEGERIEFYIEGSGGYVVSNIDLVSQEIYFTKQDILSTLDPVIFFSPQTEYPAASETSIAALNEAVEKINKRSRIPITLEISHRPKGYPIRLSSIQMRRIRKSLLYIADTTPIASIETEKKTGLLINPSVCVEIGFAIEAKDSAQILLLNMERPDLVGDVPFDLSNYKHLSFKGEADLSKTLPNLVKALLQRFNL
ncbi:MAG: hypothetical protein ACRC2R_24525 [Xenococcaceae cyanobacterium]